jgi:hypothetical protein
MEALSVLDISENNLTAGLMEAGWAEHKSEDGVFYAKEGEASVWEIPTGQDMLGILALSNAIKDMRALTSLNLSSNQLNFEGGKIVAESIKVTNCAIAVVLAPVSCPPGHWLNCCCLLLSTG